MDREIMNHFNLLLKKCEEKYKDDFNVDDFVWVVGEKTLNELKEWHDSSFERYGFHIQPDNAATFLILGVRAIPDYKNKRKIRIMKDITDELF